MTDAPTFAAFVTYAFEPADHRREPGTTRDQEIDGELLADGTGPAGPQPSDRGPPRFTRGCGS
jgi:hypothetical protein